MYAKHVIYKSYTPKLNERYITRTFQGRKSVYRNTRWNITTNWRTSFWTWRTMHCTLIRILPVLSIPNTYRKCCSNMLVLPLFV